MDGNKIPALLKAIDEALGSDRINEVVIFHRDKKDGKVKTLSSLLFVPPGTENYNMADKIVANRLPKN